MDAFLGRFSCLARSSVRYNEAGCSEFEGMVFPESVSGLTLPLAIVAICY